MRRSRFICIMLALVLAFSLAGCGDQSNEGNSGDVLNNIKKKNKLVIGLEGNWAPWSFHNDKELVGMDVEIGKRVAEKLGVEVDIKEDKWENLLKGINAGAYDMVINGVGITEEREDKYTFSEPYAFSHTVVITRGDSGIRTMYDLKDRVIANTEGSIYSSKAKKYGAKVIKVDNFDQAVEKVLTGGADACMNEDASYYQYMSENQGKDLIIAVKDPENVRIGIAMPKGVASQSLKSQVDDILEEMRDNGELKTMSKKYFGADITTE